MKKTEITREQQPIGCAAALIIVNGILMGLLALSFVSGPYSSTDQELWFRYGSIAFVLGGAILPAVALMIGARRSPVAMAVLNAWMIAALVGFAGYAMASGGGV